MKVSFELTRTGILAIAAAGIVAAGAVADRANRLFGSASPAGPAETAIAAASDGRSAERRSGKSTRP